MPTDRRFDDLSPDELDAAADALARQAKLLRELAEIRRGKPLTAVESSGTVGDGMTSAQLSRRGAAIARSVATASGDVFLIAVSRSKWKSQARWAIHAGTTAGSLTGYRQGKRPCPERIAALALSELGVPRSFWSAGVE